jgi:hypothetical protein
VFDRLVERDAEALLQPMLAQGWPAFSNTVNPATEKTRLAFMSEVTRIMKWPWHVFMTL